MPVHFFILGVIEVAVLRVASHEGQGTFTQVILKESVSGLYELCVFGFKVTGLILSPGEACILAELRLRRETIDISNLCDNACGVYRTNTGYGGQYVWKEFHLGFYSFVKLLDLSIQCLY